MAATRNDAGHLVRGLLARELVFDQFAHIWDEESFEAETAPAFTEVGASGAIHTREEIRQVVLGGLAGSHPVSLVGGYRIVDPHVIQLVDGLVQVRYTLHAQGRVTRRTTLYRRTGRSWQTVFHRGAVVVGASPLPPDRPEPPHG